MSYSTWAPSLLPTSTTLRLVDPTAASGLIATYTSAAARLSTEKKWGPLITLSRELRGAQASLSIIEAQKALATATDSLIQLYATQVIFNSTLNLKDLEWEENLYSLTLNRPGNIIYLIIFFAVWISIVGLLPWSRYHWFNVTYFCGYGLQFAGFLGRVLSFSDNTNMNYYLLQYISLTISPAFIMAGVYFLFAQLVVIFGRHFSVLKPMWYSYFFITFDVLSLMIQAGGGGAASSASKQSKDPMPGTRTMSAGIIIQVIAMSVFVIFWFEFLHRIFFRFRNEVQGDSPYKKRSIGNFFKLLLNVKSAREYKQHHLEPFYNEKFADVRSRKLFGFFPLALTVSVLVIYIRCVYRVVELLQGFDGYLITHEVYLMVLDAMMVAIAGLLAVPFHPLFVFGRENKVKLAHIKKRLDVDDQVGEKRPSVDSGSRSASNHSSQDTGTNAELRV